MVNFLFNKMCKKMFKVTQNDGTPNTPWKITLLTKPSTDYC